MTALLLRIRLQPALALVLLAPVACGLPARRSHKAPADLKLTPTSIGSLKLNSPVTLRRVEAAFPGTRIESGCGETGPSRYCYFAVSVLPPAGQPPDRQPEELFTLIAALTGKQASRALKSRILPDEEFTASSLTVASPRVTDSYGVRVGDRHSRVRRLRAGALEFGSLAESLFLGAGRLYYRFDVPPTSGGGFDRLAADATEQDLARTDARVNALNWPSPIP
jgi:hypothetical protein